MEHLRRFHVALAQSRKNKTLVEVTDVDGAGDVFLQVWPNSGNELELYLSAADAVVFATALLEAANARRK